MNKFALALLGAAGALLSAAPASAATAVFNLSVADPAAGLAAGPYGTITVTENINGSLSFSEALLNGFRIHGGNDNHDAAAFTISGDPNLTISNLTGGFAAENTTSGSPSSEPPFGTFQTSIMCTSACGNGYAGGFVGPLTFTITSSAGPLTIASLAYNTYNGSNIYFTSDLVGSNGQTGNVGATLSATPAVPEPATWALMLVGFGAVGVSMRRRGSVRGVLAQAA